MANVPELTAATHLFQCGVRYTIAGNAQIGQSVVQFVEELDEGSVFR